MFDFDRLIDRRGTYAAKWLPAAQREDMLCMGTADMDIATAPCILQALQQRVAHGVFGYTRPRPDTFTVIRAWYAQHHGMDLPEEWMILSPGVVHSLRAAMVHLTQPGDGVLVQTPVYTPFFDMIRAEGRTLVENPLHRDETGYYTMDLADLEAKLQQGVTMMMLCNPHNPVGRLWSAQELDAVLALCRKYHVALVSDDIHCDLEMPGMRYCGILGRDHSGVRVAQLISATKTFNLAGLQISTAVIPDEDLRRAVRANLTRLNAQNPNILAMEAQYAAYTQGRPWLDALLTYLQGNAQVLSDVLAQQDVITYRMAEGTYLAWLDCRALQLDDEALRAFFREDCAIDPVMGHTYGEKGFVRLNLATPRQNVVEAGRRLVQAVQARRG